MVVCMCVHAHMYTFAHLSRIRIAHEPLQIFCIQCFIHMLDVKDIVLVPVGLRALSPKTSHRIKVAQISQVALPMQNITKVH